MVTGGLDHPLGFTDSYMRLSLVYLCGFKNIQKACKKSQSFDTGLFPASGSFTRSSFNPNSEVAGGFNGILTTDIRGSISVFGCALLAFLMLLAKG
jgi:hypothetical protein